MSNLPKELMDCKTLQEMVFLARNKHNGLAIVCEGREITYNEFDQITDQMAVYLAEKGLGPAKTIVVSLNRSEKFLIAMYAVIKSGATFVPVQVNQPKARKDVIYDQLNVAFTIDDDVYNDIMKELPKTKYSGDARAAVKYARQEDDAMILYTSGSTGIPKGVCHSQSSVEYIATVYPERLSEAGILSNNISTIIAKTTSTFVSAYMFEYFSAFLCGIKLVLLNQSEQNDCLAIANCFNQYEECSIFLTPSQISSYLREAAFRDSFENISVLFVAGEPLKENVRNQILKNASVKTQILNIYGATETSYISCTDIRKNELDRNVIAPYVNVKIVNDSGDVLAPMEIGQIVVNSRTVLDRYTSTDVKWIYLDGDRYYPTGDSGYMTEDGMLAIKGRTDRMIKLHGLRIELQEIETVIGKHDTIESVAVIPSKINGEIAFLSAYYSGKGKVSENELRAFVSKYLPEIMIPARFVQLDKMPFNFNGKMDYKALNDIDAKLLQNEAGEADLTDDELSPDEKVLRGILNKLLNVETIGLNQNLLALGLDSLSTYRLISELNLLGLDIAIGDVFLGPNIKSIARRLVRTEDGTNTPEKTECDESKEYAATGVQFFWGTDITDMKKQIGMYVSQTFMCEIVYTEEALRKRVAQIIKRHPAFRAEIFLSENGPKQRIKEDINADIIYKDLRSDIQGGVSYKEYMARYASEKMASIISAEQITMLHVSCIQISDTESAFVIIANHAAVDGASMCVIKQELVDDTVSDNKDSYLSFMDHIVKPEVMKAAGDFWKEYLGESEAYFLPEKPEYTEQDKSDFNAYRGHTVKLSQKATETLINGLSEQGISIIGYINYLYGKALLSVLEKESLIVQLLTFGRGVAVPGMADTVGCLLQYIPVVICRDDTPKSFQNGYMKADSFSYYPEPLIWKAAGYDVKPALPPFLISEIFPRIATKRNYEELNIPDYEHMPVSNFIVKDEEGLKIYFHFNSKQYDEEKFTLIIEEFEKLLREEDN